MLDLIVLGQIPGTGIYLNFYIVALVIFIAFGYLLWLYYVGEGFASNETNPDNDEEQQV